jgi:hypothetical protein
MKNNSPQRHKGHEDDIFTEDNEGNEGIRFTDSDVVNQTFIGSLCSLRFENLLSEHSVARRAKLKGYTRAKSKTEERELATSNGHRMWFRR